MKMNQRIALPILLTAATILGTLAGCTQNGTGEVPSSSASAIPSDSSALSQEDTPKFTGKITGIFAEDKLINNYKLILEELSRKNPNLEFDFELAQVSDMDQKINMAHVSGQDYDFISVNNSSVTQFFAAGVLEPLDDHLKGSGLNLPDNYSESLLAVGQVGGVQYAIPQSPDCRVLAFNKKLLDAGGFEAPKTQDDVLKIAKALSGDGVYAYARQMNSLSAVYNEGCFMIANGAQICKETDTKISGSCNTPEMIAQLEYWKEMTSYMPKDMNYSDDQVRSMFAQGKLLFYIYGPWEIDRPDSEICANMEYGVDYGLIPVPGTVRDGSIAGGFYVGIGAGSKNKEAAWAMIQESLLPENICKLGVTLPADQRCYDMAPYDKPIYQPFKQAFQSATPPMPYSTNFYKIADIFYDYFNRALIGGEDSAVMMAECDTEINKLFNE